MEQIQLNKELLKAVQAGQVELLKELIEKGADVNAKDKKDYERSALCLAVEEGSLSMVTLLIDAGADVNIRYGPSNHSYTVLHYAMDKNQEVTSFLINKGFRAEKHDIKEIKDGKTLQLFIDKNIETNTCLCVAVLLRLEDQVKQLLQKSKNGLALWYGINSPDEKIWKILMESEIDINQKIVHQNRNILYEIAYVEETEFTLMAAESLIKKGIDIHIQDYDEQITPLHEAVRRKRVKLIKLLLNAGADGNIRDQKGCTPLDYAKTKTIQKILQQHGGTNSLQGPTMLCGELEIAALEKVYGRKLPAEYAAFIEDKSYKKYNGYSALLPSYEEKGPEVYFSLIREGELQITTLMEQGDEFQEDITNYLPFASLYWGDSKEPQFLVIDTSNAESCAVLMYEHEDGMFHIAAKSIKAFLKKLRKP